MKRMLQVRVSGSDRIHLTKVLGWAWVVKVHLHLQIASTDCTINNTPITLFLG